MKMGLLILILGLSLIANPVFASVGGDIRAGVPYKTAMVKALRGGQPIEQVVREAMLAAPRNKAAVLAAALSLSPRLIERVVKVAIGLGINAGDVVKLAVKVAPKSAEQVVAAALSVAPAKMSQILGAAIAAGAPADKMAEVAVANMGDLATNGQLSAVLRNNPALDAVEPDLEADTITVPSNIVIPPSRGGDAQVVSFH